jgi:hypothetical protein
MRLGMLLVPWGVPRLDLGDEGRLGRDTAPKALTTPMAACALRPVAPTAVFGGIMDGSLSGDSFGLRRRKCFRQRGVGGGMALGHHQADFLHMWSMLINQFLDTRCPIHFCPRLSAFGISLTHAWGKSDKNIGCPSAFILRVISQRLPRFSRERSTACANELGGPFSETHWGIRRVIRFVSESSDFVHGADTGSLLLRWNPPFVLLPGCTCLFFHGRRLVSWDTASPSSHSPIVSASLRKVHRSCPAGAWRQSRAIQCAASSPVIFRRWLLVTGLRSKAASPPSSTTRFLSCSTFLVDTS